MNERPPPGRAWVRHLAALGGYALAAFAYAWPLGVRMASHLPGPPTGDTGVYVWNLWVFRHELLSGGRFPLFTSMIFSLDRPVDLSLHNYTIAGDLLAVPILTVLDVVTTFNLLYLGAVVASAFGMYLLASLSVGARPEAWLAGLLFGLSPALVARSEAHLSLVAAAPLPVFLWCVFKAERTGRRRFMIAAGGALAWAAYSDPYYGVYAVLLGLWHMGARSLEIRKSSAGTPVAPAISRGLDAAIAVLLLVVALIAWTGGTQFGVMGRTVSMTGLHTPVLLLTVVLAARLLMWRGPFSVRWRPTPEFRTLLRLAPYGITTSAVVLAPVLAALAVRIWEGRYVSPRIFWRSSAPGVDLAAMFMPNPNHPLASPWFRQWLTNQSGGFAENVAALTFVALAVLVIAFARRLGVGPAYWLAFTLVFASLALGPFVRVAGVATYVPTPWALVRYVPVLGDARMPTRFMVLVMMGLAMLVATALSRLGAASPAGRRALLLGVGGILVFELCPAPRAVYSADIPAFYATIAADPRDVRVLELPFGIRDGLSSHGDFNASSQFYQTRHGKRLIGGYLSRVSAFRVESNRRRPVLAAMLLLSEGRPISAEVERAAQEAAGRFIREARLGYVVVDRKRASPALVAFAIRTLGLRRLATSGSRDLYQPTDVADVAAAAR